MCVFEASRKKWKNFSQSAGKGVKAVDYENNFHFSTKIAKNAQKYEIIFIHRLFINKEKFFGDARRRCFSMSYNANKGRFLHILDIVLAPRK